MVRVIPGDFCAMCEKERLFWSLGTPTCKACGAVFETDAAPAVDLVPDVLTSMIDRRAIHEREGVHVVATLSSIELQPGAVEELTVLLQNAWDAPRKVDVLVRATRQNLFHRSQRELHVDPHTLVELRPAEVVRVSIPVEAPLDSSGFYRIELGIRVEGLGGRRLRRGRRESLDEGPLPTPVWWLLVLGALSAGHFFLPRGNTIAFDLDVDSRNKASEIRSTRGSRTIWSLETQSR